MPIEAKSEAAAPRGQLNAALEEGTYLQGYTILRVMATGGFSFVYLAHDENETPVAIKEYLPSTLALRVNGEKQPSIPEADLAKFRYGMKCFFEEGKALAQLSHPNVVRVLNFFRANETVYLVMRYERGRTLQEHIKIRRGALDEAWIRKTFAQLLTGLREVHSNKLLHLDIKPANVYIRNDGTPLLIDFGAARQTLSAEGVALPPTYTPGFASPEQHRTRELLGPWSDIYSVGATLYACLSASSPQPAQERLEKDLVTPARRAFAGRYSAELLDTVDWCMRLDHLERPQSVFALQKALLGEKVPEHRGDKPLLDQIRGMLRLK
jgi:serine/threonine protein kinase